MHLHVCAYASMHIKQVKHNKHAVCVAVCVAACDAAYVAVCVAAEPMQSCLHHFLHMHIKQLSPHAQLEQSNVCLSNPNFWLLLEP
jgi:hypothetical protein